MVNGGQLFCLSRTGSRHQRVRSAHRNAVLGHASHPNGRETVLALHQQGRERAVVVIPTPAPSVRLAISHAQVLAHLALYASNTGHGNRTYQRIHLGRRNRGIHSAHHIEVALQHGATYLARHVQGGAQTVLRSQIVKCRHGCYHLLARCRTHAMVGIAGIERRILREVMDVDTHLRSLSQTVVVAERVQRSPDFSLPTLCHGLLGLCVLLGRFFTLSRGNLLFFGRELDLGEGVHQFRSRRLKRLGLRGPSGSACTKKNCRHPQTGIILYFHRFHKLFSKYIYRKVSQKNNIMKVY